MIRHVYRINCDCAMYYDTRRRRVGGGRFLRCRGCGRQLGDAEAEYVGRFEGASEQSILDRAKRNNKPLLTVEEIRVAAGIDKAKE